MDVTCPCGTVFRSARANARFCSRKCNSRTHRDSAVKICSTGCGRPLRAKGFCNPCYRRDRRKAGRSESQPWNDRRRNHYHRRRELQTQASTNEPVSLEYIRGRDQSRCHLCRKLMGRKPWPHPLSPSLDHLVPLTKGGLHEPANVRLAHLGCNSSKGNRGGNEQLLLIG